MELFNSEEEQIEALKRWWRENGRSAMAGIVIGITAIIGWNVWQTHKENQAREASAVFQQLLKAVEEKRTESVERLSTRLNDLYESTPYPAYADLFLAKLKTEAGDLPAARQALQAAIAATDDGNLKHVARLRLIQLMLANAQAEAALQMIAELDMGQAGRFEGRYQDLKGDSYAILNRRPEALTAYQRAADLGNRSVYLQIKIQDLAGPPIQEPAE